MSPSSDLHDDPRHQQALAELPSLALGEPLDADLADHVAGCADCQAELGSFRGIVGLARGSRLESDAAAPPPAVWRRIEAELAAPGVTELAPARARRARRPLLLGAAVVAALGIGLGGWALGRSETPAPSTLSHASLAAQPGTPAAAHGTATVHQSADGYRVDLDTSGLPAPSGYYEVWLYAPSVDRMVAIGTLGTGARGTFTVPAGLDMSAYHVVDVSAQKFDGNAQHERSVLRGALAN